MDRTDMAAPQTASEIRAEARGKFRAQMAVGTRIAAAILLTPFIINHAIPGSLWYELGRVHVDDAPVGGPVQVHVERRIHRPFMGQYVVAVRPVGLSEPVCNGGMVVAYKKSSSAEVNRDLEYWSAGAVPPCTPALEPGRYIMTTTIIIQTGIPFLPRRTVTAESNVFRIHATEGR